MINSKRPDLTIAAFLNQYEHYLVDVRGLARNSCRLHTRVVCTLLEACFTSGNVIWNALRFEQIAAFLTKEFRRLPNHWTQRAWLMAVRGLIRYLEAEGCIPNGWREALPKRISWKQASLPRSLSLEQTQALWDSCVRQTHRHVRDRALLLVFTNLGLRTEEVARLAVKDVDWKGGSILIRSTKTRRERILPLPDDVGRGLVQHLRVRPQQSPEIFGPRCPPFTPERNHDHVRNAMASLFRRAGIPHCRLHSLRHTAASGMVNRGATFKEIADVLGHKSVSTTMIYAKLDMDALAKVALPWPGVTR
ncbi:MAG TPA: tyrosine-type recombinase/integrase [Bryobacteraceae bacterium]|jgi:integrase